MCFVSFYLCIAEEHTGKGYSVPHSNTALILKSIKYKIYISKSQLTVHCICVSILAQSNALLVHLKPLPCVKGLKAIITPNYSKSQDGQSD